MFKPVAFAVVLLLAPVALSAQQGSPYVPLNDRVMPFVEHLIRSGVMADPDPLTRPLKRSAILDALRNVDTTRASASVRGMTREVQAMLAPRAAPPMIGLDFTGGLSAGTHARRDPLRPGGPKYLAWQAGGLIRAAMGPLVLSSHPFFDSRMAKDPDYPGVGEPLSFRITDAYVSVQTRYAEMTYGSVDRNWGPPGIEGLVLSSAPYSYDHLFARLGVTGLRVESVLAQLNDTVNATGQFDHRWLVAHRFVFRPWPRFTGVIGQASLWQGGGPADQTWYLNPTRIAHVTRLDDNLADSVNTMISGDFSLRLPGGIVLQAEGLIDDIALLEKTAPDRLAGTLMLDVPVKRAAGVRFLWTVVSSITYRTFQGPISAYMRHDVGLARNFDDYTQWTVSGTVAPHPRVVLTPELTLLLQGEGDIRKQPPPLPIPTYPFLLVGTTERTLRVGLGTRARAWRGVDIDTNAGLHFIANRQNVAGASATRFVGALSVTYHFGGEYRAP